MWDHHPHRFPVRCYCHHMELIKNRPGGVLSLVEASEVLKQVRGSSVSLCISLSLSIYLMRDFLLNNLFFIMYTNVFYKQLSGLNLNI